MSIKILEQPKDQRIQFRNNQETVELTCTAESYERYNLRYEWYCVDSSDIISDKYYAEITLRKPSGNMEKQYYCKVSIANDSEHHVTSRMAVIKLEISKSMDNMMLLTGYHKNENLHVHFSTHAHSLTYDIMLYPVMC